MNPEPFTQAELLESLGQINADISAHFSALTPAVFFQRVHDEWSPAENLVHLIKSNSPLAKAMNLPRLLSKIAFGAKNSSRPYREIKADYLVQLAAGAQAAGGFLPAVENSPSDAVQAQREIIQKWIQVGNNLLTVIQKWNEPDLDQHVLPHPLLGKLTVREMLCFTHYHNFRHLTAGHD